MEESGRKGWHVDCHLCQCLQHRLPLPQWFWRISTTVWIMQTMLAKVTTVPVPCKLSFNRGLASSSPHPERFSDWDHPINISAAPLHVVFSTPCPEARAFASSPWPWGIITSTHFMLKFHLKFCYLEHKPKAAVICQSVIWETPMSRLSLATVCTGSWEIFLQIVRRAWMVTTFVRWPGRGTGVRSTLVLHFNPDSGPGGVSDQSQIKDESNVCIAHMGKGLLDCGIPGSHEVSPGRWLRAWGGHVHQH